MFAESSEEIEGSCCGASDAEAVSLGLRMLAGVVGNLKLLKLAGNRIGEAGVVSLAEGLRVNSSLQVLDLQSNEVGGAGAIALGEMLKVNSSLQTLLLVSVLICFDLLLTCLCCE